jgi:hypothetical protein
MGSSYSRNCRFCGQHINLRQMPNGAWRAFEGYDQPHNCRGKPAEAMRKPVVPRSISAAQLRHEDDLDFAPITVPTILPWAKPSAAPTRSSVPVKSQAATPPVGWSSAGPTARPSTGYVQARSAPQQGSSPSHYQMPAQQQREFPWLMAALVVVGLGILVIWLL